MEITYRKLTSTEFEQALQVRFRVFVDEQKVPESEERDHDDKTAIHFGAFDQNTIVATGRVVIIEDQGKIGRLAVLKPYRGHNIGISLLNTIVAYCTNQGLSQVYLGSQIQALDFYHKAGFTAEGGIFDDAGIPHRLMRKILK